MTKKNLIKSSYRKKKPRKSSRRRRKSSRRKPSRRRRKSSRRKSSRRRRKSSRRKPSRRRRKSSRRKPRKSSRRKPSRRRRKSSHRRFKMYGGGTSRGPSGRTSPDPRKDRKKHPSLWERWLGQQPPMTHPSSRPRSPRGKKGPTTWLVYDPSPPTVRPPSQPPKKTILKSTGPAISLSNERRKRGEEIGKKLAPRIFKDHPNNPSERDGWLLANYPNLLPVVGIENPGRWPVWQQAIAEKRPLEFPDNGSPWFIKRNVKQGDVLAAYHRPIRFWRKGKAGDQWEMGYLQKIQYPSKQPGGELLVKTRHSKSVLVSPRNIEWCWGSPQHIPRKWLCSRRSHTKSLKSALKKGGKRSHKSGAGIRFAQSEKNKAGCVIPKPKPHYTDYLKSAKGIKYTRRKKEGRSRWYSVRDPKTGKWQRIKKWEEKILTRCPDDFPYLRREKGYYCCSQRMPSKQVVCDYAKYIRDSIDRFVLNDKKERELKESAKTDKASRIYLQQYQGVKRNKAWIKKFLSDCNF